MQIYIYVNLHSCLSQKYGQNQKFWNASSLYIYFRKGSNISACWETFSLVIHAFPLFLPQPTSRPLSCRYVTMLFCISPTYHASSLFPLQSQQTYLYVFQVSSVLSPLLSHCIVFSIIIFTLPLKLTYIVLSPTISHALEQTLTIPCSCQTLNTESVPVEELRLFWSSMCRSCFRILFSVVLQK